MRAINHALTGALIGLTVSEPAIALPAALLSHYILDAIPHHGIDGVAWLRSKMFRYQLYVDTALCGILVLILALTRPANWWLAAVCAFLAAAPDLISFNRYWHVVRRKKWKGGLYYKFAHGIQWFERPIGAVVEISWFGACLVLLWQFFR